MSAPAPKKLKRSPSPLSSPSHSRTSSPSDTKGRNADPMAFLRAHFESRFEPIDIAPVIPIPGDPDDEEEDEWSGISSGSDSDDGKQEVVVSHTVSEADVRSVAQGGMLLVSKRDRQAFLLGKLPAASSSTPAPARKRRKGSSADASDSGSEDDAQTEALNLKNDLALQRLLKESHLLAPDSASFEATGANRLKAVESRLQMLGVKPTPGQNMAMHMRKGIEGKQAKREKKRRKEARENGIILEKENRQRKKTKRDRGLVPSIGKFRGGTLVLGKKDVHSIVGGRESSGGRSGRAGKSKGRRRK